MNQIPKHIVDEYKKDAERSRFFGISVSELDRDELLAMIGCLSRQVTESRERAAAYLDMIGVLNRANHRA